MFAMFRCAAVPLAVVALAASAGAEDARKTGSDIAQLAGQAPVRVILDTDMDSDCDDAGALGMLHALADREEVEILAVTTSSLDPFSGPCTDAINTYYGRSDLSIGTARAPAPMAKSRYTQGVAEAAPHDLKRNEDAPDAVELYCNVLSEQPDGSVTLVSVGELTNLAKLLEAPAAGERPSGAELVRRKVKLWVCMGGNFVGTPARDDLKLTNNNFTLNAKAAYIAVNQWPTPIVFVGREIGSVPSGLKVGARLKEAPADHPVRIAYEQYFGGQAKDRHIADLTTVLYAVRGLRDYWRAESRGSMDLQADMTFTWNNEADRPQAYLLKRTGDDGKPNDRQIERAIEELLLQPPAARK